QFQIRRPPIERGVQLLAIVPADQVESRRVPGGPIAPNHRQQGIPFVEPQQEVVPVRSAPGQQSLQQRGEDGGVVVRDHGQGGRQVAECLPRRWQPGQTTATCPAVVEGPQPAQGRLVTLDNRLSEALLVPASQRPDQPPTPVGQEQVLWLQVPE